MDNMKGIGGGNTTCYAPMKAEEKTAKPPVTCYAPMTADKVEKGGSEIHDTQKKQPTATCYMPVDDGGPWFLNKEPEAGLSDKQVENRMKLMEQRANETK